MCRRGRAPSPTAVDGPAEPERPDAVPCGISTVIASGVPVIERGRPVPAARPPGRVLRRGAAPVAAGDAPLTRR